jgi:signal peptidase I
VHRFADPAARVAAAHFLWLNRTGTRAKVAPERLAARRKSPIKNLHSGTSGFLKLWRSLAAKSNPLIFRAMLCERIRSLQSPTPSRLETSEDPKLDLAAEMLRNRGVIHLKAWGASMLPSVWPGDLLTIRGAGYDEIVPGDIVLIRRDDRIVIHRLVARHPAQDRFSWITRGDAMSHNDPPIAQSELLGRVASIHRAHRSFIPSRRVSLFHSVLAWMLCRWDRFRNLTLRIHAVRAQADPTRVRGLARNLMNGHGLPRDSRAHTPHS